MTTNDAGRPGEIVEYIISASSGPSGENPTGSVAARTNVLPPPTNIFEGPVTCLSVHANVALLNVPGPFGLVAFRITDGASTGVADLVETGFAAGGTTECSLPAPLYTGVGRVVSGDLVVHDALAVPTSKDQCKNAGWTTFRRHLQEPRPVRRLRRARTEAHQLTPAKSRGVRAGA